MGIANARMAYDRDYFETCYDDSLDHRMKWRPYAKWLFGALVLLGVQWAAAYPKLRILGLFLIAVGLYEFAMAMTHRRRWVRARLTGTSDDKSVDLAFDQTEMFSESPLGSATLRYAGFQEIVEGSRGFFLVPDTGVSLYVPRSALEDEATYEPLVQLLRSEIGSSAH